jgi:hypothetical protein
VRIAHILLQCDDIGSDYISKSGSSRSSSSVKVLSHLRILGLISCHTVQNRAASRVSTRQGHRDSMKRRLTTCGVAMAASAIGAEGDRGKLLGRLDVGKTLRIAIDVVSALDVGTNGDLLRPKVGEGFPETFEASDHSHSSCLCNDRLISCREFGPAEDDRH